MTVAVFLLNLPCAVTLSALGSESHFHTCLAPPTGQAQQGMSSSVKLFCQPPKKKITSNKIMIGGGGGDIAQEGFHIARQSG